MIVVMVTEVDEYPLCTVQGSSFGCVATWDELSSRSHLNTENHTLNPIKHPTLITTLQAGGSAFTSVRAITPSAFYLADRLMTLLHDIVINTKSVDFIV